MNRKNILTKVYLLSTCAGLLAFQACDDNVVQPVSEQEEINTVQNSNDMESMADEDVALIDEIIATSAENGRLYDGTCAVVTRDVVEKVITIDFGDGCIDRLGRERSGKIIITFRGEISRRANRRISFEDYFIDNRNITGSILIINFHRNDEGNLTSTRKLVDYTINYPDGNSFVKNGSVTREWIEGEGDTIRHKNVFRITGSYNGVSTKGREITYTITEPVIVDYNCRASGGFIRVAGVVEMRVSFESRSRTRIVKYGDGTCDQEINVNINGRTVTINVNKG